MPGPTLRDAVRASGPFPPDSALRLFAALAEGLATVHVHGARGTHEVPLRNEVGPAADIFALGATIACTATGRPPYGSGDASAVSYRTVHEDIDLTGVRDDLAALIRRCVAKDPAERPELAAVIAGCAVDSALAADAHYRSVARDAEAVPEAVPEHVSVAEPERQPYPSPCPPRGPDAARAGSRHARWRSSYRWRSGCSPDSATSDDPGDWPVMLSHVEGGPTKYTSIVCNGFHA